MADNDEPDPVLRDDHHLTQKYGTKFIDQTEKYQHKFQQVTGKDKKHKKEPAGGYDDTPVLRGAPGYTLRITFHRASNLPFADVPSFSSDPYIMAVFRTALPKRHKQDPDLQLRIPTIHRDTNPSWETTWTIAHVPSSGFHLKCRLYDEDPSDHDDRLGNVHVEEKSIGDNWKGFKERHFDIKKRMGSKRAYTFRGCAALLSSNVKMSGELVISIDNLGRSEGNGGRAYTIAPLAWSQHYSPLIGLIAGTKARQEGKDGKETTEKHNFQAIQMQLQGPVPEHLYHRYVEFRPFVAGMFTSHTLRGKILNHALHHQHARIYNYDSTTKYGQFDKPCVEMTKLFLDFVNYDRGGRIYTYVISLDGQIRFTETGKEFGIDLLSKHTMHSDVSSYIAFSGEFFIRRLKHARHEKGATPDPASDTLPPAPMEPKEDDNGGETKYGEIREVKQGDHKSLVPSLDQHRSRHEPNSDAASDRQSSRSLGKHRLRSADSSKHSPASHAEATHEDHEPSIDPSHYELIIDNDSGTYRPNAKYLGDLKDFLRNSFPGIRVAVLDCQKDEKKMNELKDEQRERKKNSGQRIAYMQNMSSSSLSSSDEEELQRRAGEGNDEPGSAGGIKGKLNKARQHIKSDQEESHSTFNTNEKASSPQGRAITKKESTSTGRNASFDTATEHGDNHFVTPKPSLGYGGLRAFDEEERPLSRDINKELEKRGFEGWEQEKVFNENERNFHEHTENPGTPGATSTHHAVTSAA